MDDSTPFAVDLLRPGDGVAIVELQGEVDIHGAPQFKEALLQGIETVPGESSSTSQRSASSTPLPWASW